MADCTKKIDQELRLLDNLIVTEPIVTKFTGAARTPTEYTGVARNPTKDITSVARNTINISMIGVAPFNHLVQQSQKNPSQI